MSNKSSPSPHQGPQQIDVSSLPQGHCRYILLLPEVKGQRCACVNFNHNRSIPGATCDCGHLSCFHNKEAEPAGMDQLKQRLRALEEMVAHDRQAAKEKEDDASQAVIARINGVEEDIERSREEFGQEIKRVFSNSTLAWNFNRQLQDRVARQEEQMAHVLNRLADVDNTVHRLDNRQLELQDADTYLEERIEYIQETLDEKDESDSRGRDPRPRRMSTSDMSRLSNPLGDILPSGPASTPSQTLASRQRGGDAFTTVHPVPTRHMPSAGIWTVHISLLPHATVPMPFERNTNAYQRCLSRGLHQVVPIRGRTAEAFSTAVTKAFGVLLRGRPWMPLQAELCNAEQLQGLPMLRQLEPHLLDSPYDADFLRENCAVCDANGMMESLYITMRAPHALSWHAVRRAPVFTEGLEEAWEFDPLLDNDPYDDDDFAVDDDERPAAGDIVPALPNLKRTAHEMQRSASFGATTAQVAAAGDGLPRTKRACPVAKKGIVDARRPGVGTA